MRGFKEIGILYNYNPRIENELAENVVVLDGLRALAQAVKLKAENKIKRVISGPLLGKEFFAEGVDIFLVPSEWVKKSDAENDFLVGGKSKVWYSGVDENFWQPTGSKTGHQALIYWKNGKRDFFQKVEKILLENGLITKVIHYGRYSPDQYKQLLSEVDFAVVLSQSESQGLALAESWSMDVPTLCWNPQEPIIYAGRTFNQVSSCPYLTKETGRDWKTLEELKVFIKQIKNKQIVFNPRQWVLENMTDKISAKLLLDLINE